MKRNKHHGLNVEFDGLCMDFGHVSLNKKKEFLCGDCYKIEENDEDHVLVLSDGLGSGVKANILSTLTATMLSTMIINLPIPKYAETMVLNDIDMDDNFVIEEICFIHTKETIG